MSREHAQLKLRLAPELRDKIVESAEHEGRSINAELVHRLELSFGPATLPEAELPSPEAARQQSLNARDQLAELLKTVTARKIRDAIAIGAIETSVDASADLGLDTHNMDEALVELIILPALQHLDHLGYTTHKSDIGSFDVSW